MKESSPEDSLDDLVKQAAQLCEDLQLGVGDLVFFSRDCSRLPWQHAAICYGAKAFHNEWDHIGVVIEMDEINNEGKGNEGRNDRKLVLLEANKAVVAYDLIERMARSQSRKIGVRRLNCLRSERFRKDAEFFAASVVGRGYDHSLLQLLLAGVRNHPPKERRRKAHGDLMREEANRRHLKNIQKEILDPDTRKQLEVEFRDTKRSIQVLINALEERLSALENEPSDLSTMFCGENVSALYQRLGLLPTSTPSNDYTPIDFESYGVTGQRSRLHFAMGSYLEPMVLLKTKGKMSTVAARQLPVEFDHDRGDRQLQIGERFASENQTSSCGYEIIEGDAVVFMDMNNKEKNKEDDDSSLSSYNVATCKFKKGDCFGFISDSWSAVAGEEGVRIRPVPRKNMDCARRERKLISSTVRLGAVFDRFVDDGETMNLTKFCDAAHMPIVEGFILGKRYEHFHPAGEMAYELAKEVGTGNQATRSGFIEIVGDILGPDTTAKTLDVLTARFSDSSSPAIKEHLTEENIAEFRRLWKDDTTVDVSESSYSSSIPALWDTEIFTQLAAWAAAVIAVSPLNHATLMAQCRPRPESVPLSIHGGGKWRGSPFLAAWMSPAIVGSCFGYRYFWEYLQSCGNAKESSAVIAGGITGLVTGLLLTPVELTFSRYASGNVRSLLEAVRLLNSNRTTLARAAPLSACWGLVFGGVLGLGAAINVKDSLSKTKDFDHVLHHQASQHGHLYEAHSLIKSAWADGDGRAMVCAAGIATLLAHPLDAARKRLALQGFSNPAPYPRSISYLRGSPGNVLRVSIVAAMAWTFGMTKELKSY